MSIKKEELISLAEEKLKDLLLIVVSNREPYIHQFSDGKIEWRSAIGGLTVALDPVMRACKGIWIAWGSGDADKLVVDKSDKIAVPPDEPKYILRRVWLSKEEVDGFYYGFSNEAIWPLCHITFTRPIFSQEDWEIYKRVNKIFSQVVYEEVKEKEALVFIQDYHLALLPRLLKEMAPHLVIGHFWHIPFPTYELFRICPQAKELLDGLLGNDILGFHIQSYCHNFLDAAKIFLKAEVNYETSTILYQGKRTLVRPYPISIDFHHISQKAGSREVEEEIAKLRKELNLNYPFIGISTNRIDYTKGIPERLMALDKLLERHPEYRGKLVFLEVSVPSRVNIPHYQRINEEIEHLVETINQKYETEIWKPIIKLKGQMSPITLYALKRLAHFCIVSALHDGMNLVAKEFVASRIDEDGVLLLSQFAGASEELTDALIINPYDIDDFALKIKRALEMPPEERRARMRRMRAVVQENDIYRWALSILSDLLKLKDETAVGR